MKSCPTCQRSFTDETLKFCRDDGTLLVSEVPFTDASTAILTDSVPRNSSLEATRTFPQPFPVTETPSPQTRIDRLPNRRSAGKAIDSIAVLPLVNTSPDPEMEYLSDGITESIINALSQLPKLRVVARSTVFRYKGHEVDPREVGQQLGVRAVLTGRVRQFGDKMEIAAELIDVTNDAHLWGEHYRRKPSDIFELQEEIAKEILEKLRLKLRVGEKKRLTKRHTENTDAYHLYLKGLFYWNKRTPDGLNAAIAYFQEAITNDPSYALAYAGLAHCYMLLSLISGLPSAEVYPKAKTAAMKALEIDDAMAEAYAALAHIKFYRDWDWAGAEIEYKRAIKFNPNYATAHHYYAVFSVYMGRFDRALDQYNIALQLDPLSLPIGSSLGWALFSARRYDEAIEQCEKSIELDSNFARTHLYLGEIYLQKGMYDEAIVEFQMAEELSGELWARVMLAHTYAVSGRRNEADMILNHLRSQPGQSNISPFQLAMIYAGLGEKDRAFEWLEKAFEQRDNGLVELKVVPMLDSLRSDPRFRDFVQRVGFT